MGPRRCVHTLLKLTAFFRVWCMLLAVLADSSSTGDLVLDSSTAAAVVADSSSAVDASTAAGLASSAADASSTAATDASTADAASSTAAVIADSSSAIDVSTAVAQSTAADASSTANSEQSSAAAAMSSAALDSSSASMDAGSSTSDAASTGNMNEQSSSAMDMMSSAANTGLEASSTAATPAESSTGSGPAVTSTYFARADMFSGSVETNPLLNLTVLFSQNAPGEDVTITVTVNNLPAGVYGFHIHTYGDVTSKNPINSNFTGGHFNPLGRPHACWPAMDRQVGDIGNLTSTGIDGQQVTFVRNLIELSGNNQSVIGRSVILHKLPDTCGQPTGAAGTYWAEGVIGIAAPPAPFTTNLAASAGVPTPFTGEALMVPVPSAFPVVAAGTVSFATQPSGLVRIVASFTGLPPNTTLAMVSAQCTEGERHSGTATQSGNDAPFCQSQGERGSGTLRCEDNTSLLHSLRVCTLFPPRFVTDAVSLCVVLVCVCACAARSRVG